MTVSPSEVWVVVVPATRQAESISAEMIGEARRLVGKGIVRALVVGDDVRSAAPALARWDIDSVVLVEDLRLASYHPEVFATVVADALRSADLTAVLFPGTVVGSDLGARVAIELGRRFHGGCLNFELSGDEIKVTRSVAEGKFHQIERASGMPYLLSLVPDTVGGGAPGAARTVDMSALTLDIQAGPTSLRDLGFIPADHRTVDIVDADIVVSGGRGVGGPDGFALVEELADLLGASVGASRPAVEAGWAPYERQVGQTGRVVKPQLYVACGISGATQHLAGMREAKTIIAINIDPAAPILALATLAVEGDLQRILSALVARLRDREEKAA